MWPLFVIFNFPPVGGFPHFVQVAEQIQGENLVAIRLVKAFNERVLVRFAGLNVLNRHPGLFGPGNEFTAEKLRTVIGSQHIRQATLQAKPFKDPDQSFSGDRGIDLNMQQLAIEIVDHVKSPESTTGIERIAHKVGGPDLVRLERYK